MKIANANIYTGDDYIVNIAVISGKEGTGKTTIAKALTELAIDVIKMDCGACKLVCPQNFIKLSDEKKADTSVEIEDEGSKDLITHLRKNGKEFNDDEKLTITDGTPGVGCPAISIITGSDAVLVVTEPTKPDLQDLMRVVALCEFFGVFTMVCINKYDINEEVAREIENFVNYKGFKLVGKIPYDDTVMKSINEVKPITCYKESTAQKAIEEMWSNIKNYM